MAGEKLKWRGSSLWKTLWKLLLSPLNMAHVHILSYRWVIFFSLSHANLMSHYTPLIHLKSSLVIITLWLVISRQVNVSKSLVMPHNVQVKFQPQSTISQYSWPFIPMSVYSHFIYYITSSNYLISCQWWRIHQHPPSMSLFLYINFNTSSRN